MNKYDEIIRRERELTESYYALADAIKAADREHHALINILNHLARGHDIEPLIDNLKTYTVDENGDMQVDCDDNLIENLITINRKLQAAV